MILSIPKRKTQQKKNEYTHAHLKCCSICYKFKIFNYLCFEWFFNFTFKKANAWLTYISSSTLYCVEERLSDTDGDVKDWLNGVSTELMKGGGGHGTGRVRGDRYGKGRKNYQRHLTCSSSHYFPQFLSLENMQQHTKTATCSLQAPCNNSLGQTARATIPYFSHQDQSLLGNLNNGLTFVLQLRKTKTTYWDTDDNGGRMWRQTHIIISANVMWCLWIISGCDLCSAAGSFTGLLCDRRVTCIYKSPHAAMRTVIINQWGNCWVTS